MTYGLTPPRVIRRGTMQVRFFREPDLEALERAVNAWLAQRPDREIAEVCQSVIPEAGGEGGRIGEIVVSVWYIEE